MKDDFIRDNEREDLLERFNENLTRGSGSTDTLYWSMHDLSRHLSSVLESTNLVGIWEKFYNGEFDPGSG